MNDIELKLLRAQIMLCVDEVDRQIMDDIRRSPHDRPGLLSQLDVLERVRERLHVRFERFSGDGNRDGQ